MRRRLILLTLLLAPGLALWWLVNSQSGLQAGSALLVQASGGHLVLNGLHGRLSGPLQIDELRWQTPDLQIEAKGLHVDWSPRQLLERRLQVGELSIDRLTIDSAASDTPAQPPADLGLPVAVDLERIAISTLRYGTLPAVRQIDARLHSDGTEHRLETFSARSGDTRLDARLRLAGNAPFALSGEAVLNGQLDAHPLQLRLSVAGQLAAISLDARAEAGLQGKAAATLTPFAPALLQQASLALDELDPAAWQAGAPSARLALRGELRPEAGAPQRLSGHFRIDNARPGPLDRQQLPLENLGSRFAWQAGVLTFSQIEARLPGRATLAGEARLASGILDLDLQARQVDAARIFSMLRSTRLAGPISARLAPTQQDLKLDLRDPLFQISAEARHADRRLVVQRLSLQHGTARLNAEGWLDLGPAMSFNGQGELHGFDPSRFAQLPEAQINARFSADGRLEPQATINARFDLDNSRLAGQPLSGKGNLNIAWPRIPNLDLQLVAGPNRLTGSGAFGRPGDHLQIRLDAPKLDPYGIEGSLNGQFNLSSERDQNLLSATLETPGLARRGLGRLKGLNLAATLGSAPSAPLRVTMALAALDSAEQRDIVRNIKLQLDGSQQAHRLTASAQGFGRDEIKLALNGALGGNKAQPDWRGQLTELTLNSEEKQRNFHLTQPAPLTASQTAWQLGPLQLGGDGGGQQRWQLNLQAGADRQHLKASVHGQGERLGQLDGQLDATMRSAWQIDPDAHWLGELQTDSKDLGWLGEWLGERIHSAGRLKGRLKLAGSPAQPLVSGQFKGDSLSLKVADQGLALANGELDVSMVDNLLRVTRLSFDSVLQALPRALQRSDDATLQQLVRRPGRLEISGEMRVDRSTAADKAFLDVHLDRFGLYQLPDQWVAISGDGRLALQDAALSVRGKLAVDAGYWQLAQMGTPRLSDDVVIKSKYADPAASKPRPRLDLDLGADFGQHFLFRGAGLSTRLSGDLRLRAEGRDLPRASGNIRMRDGRFDAYGQQLSIERGVLSFQGLLDNPTLDVRAVRTGLAVEPGVQISGSARKPVIRLISDPELPEAEKLAWLVLGHGPEQVGAGDASVLLSAASGLLGNDSGGVIQQLKSSFGIDEFGVRSGQVGDAGGRQRTSRVAASSVDTASTTGNQILSVGKRLSSNAVLSYEQALGKAESVVKLTVNLNRQISVIGRAGSDNALDLFYTLTFGRPARPLNGRSATTAQ
jgi:translocation and assembly module TamB